MTTTTKTAQQIVADVAAFRAQGMTWGRARKAERATRGILSVSEIEAERSAKKRAKCAASRERQIARMKAAEADRPSQALRDAAELVDAIARGDAVVLTAEQAAESVELALAAERGEVTLVDVDYDPAGDAPTMPRSWRRR